MKFGRVCLRPIGNPASGEVILLTYDVKLMSKTNFRVVGGAIAQWLRLRAYHLAVPGLNPKHTIGAYSKDKNG